MTNIKYQNLINGKFVGSDEYIDIYSPINQTKIGDIPSMTTQEIDHAISFAVEQKETWKNFNIQDRARILYKATNILEKNIDKIALIMMKEIAKNYRSCKEEIGRTIQLIRYTCKIGTELKDDIIYGSSFDKNNRNIAIVKKEPRGVVLAIVPFNYPINLAASKIIPALIGGNTVIVKPPSQGAMSTLELIKCLHEAGLPNGVLNSVTGKGSKIGDYLNTHPSIDFINFTGSTQTGQHIAKISNITPTIMELGGKDAALVLDKESVELASKHIVKGAFDYSGQRCTAIKRVFVLKQHCKELENKLIEMILKLTVGNPEDNCVITPLITQNSVDFAKKLYDDAVNKGARVLVKFQSNGNLMHPCLLSDVKENMSIAWQEPFAPILPILVVDSIEEMIYLHNKSEYGLQASIFTQEITKALELTPKLDVGTVNINQKTQRGPDNFPFLGIKNSGIGVQGISYSIDSMLRIKNVVISR